MKLSSGINIVAKNGYLFAKKPKAMDCKVATSVDQKGDFFNQQANTDSIV